MGNFNHMEIDQNGAACQCLQLERSHEEWQQALSLKPTKTQPGEPPTHGWLKNWLCAVLRALCVWGEYQCTGTSDEGFSPVTVGKMELLLSPPAWDISPQPLLPWRPSRRPSAEQHELSNEVLTKVLLAPNVLPGGKSASGMGSIWAGVYAALRVMEAPGWT